MTNKTTQTLTISATNPVALYNADKQILIGYFNSRSLAGKFVLGPADDGRTVSKISYIISKKGRIRSNRLNCKIAARNLFSEGLIELGDKPFLIKNEQYLPFASILEPVKFINKGNFNGSGKIVPITNLNQFISGVGESEYGIANYQQKKEYVLKAIKFYQNKYSTNIIPQSFDIVAIIMKEFKMVIEIRQVGPVRAILKPLILSNQKRKKPLDLELI
jgi:hypothetical protein